MDRRAFLITSAAFCALTGRISSAMAQTPGNAIIVAHTADLGTADAGQVSTLSDVRVMSNMYEGLLKFADGTLDPAPALAESWSVSEDGLVYTFKLRSGVVFHDGTPFNAESVKFNLDRAYLTDHPFHGTGPFPLTSLLGPITSVEAPDETTVVVTYSSQFAPALSAFAGSPGMICGVSQAAVEQYNTEFARRGCGTGPFKLTSWQPNQQIVLEANPDYWGEKALLAGIVYKPIVEEAVRVNEIITGSSDLLVEVPSENVPGFRNDPAVQFFEQDAGHLWFLNLDQRVKPFDDKRVRQAMNYAINKQAICDNVLQGTAIVSAGIFPPAFGGAYDPDLAPYPYDPDKARELLAEAGYPDGFTVKFGVTQNGSGLLSPVLMGAAIQADLAAIGVTAEIETMEWNAYLARVLADMSGFEIIEMAYNVFFPDMHPTLGLETGGAFNSSHYSNPRLDELLAEARQTTDADARNALYRELNAEVHEDCPYVFVCHWRQNAVASTAVQNVKLQPSFMLPLAEAAKA